MAKKDTPARRSSGYSKQAGEKLAKAADSARGAMRRLKAREKTLQAKAAGAAGAYFSSSWWAKRRADAEKGTIERAGYKIGNVELDGQKIGLIAATAGAMGVLSNELYDEGLYGAGVGVLSSENGINKYKLRLAELPE